MKSPLLFFAFILTSSFSFSQSKTTEALNKKYSDAMAFFFYNNTLRMLNQSEDKDFDALIKDIEKLKFLVINKSKGFGDGDYKKITSDYKSESFDEIMTSRFNGKNFDIYLKEKEGKTNGMVVLVNDSSNLYVLDIVGRIALDKVTKLYNTIDQSSDIGKRIKAFAGDMDDKKSEHKNH